ncbi:MULTISPECIES: VOC family protein [Acinetobacter]|uniref:VOC family protein n=1 Tax=Acinetobacter TaxID=469 RepID=UPI001E57B4B7|nr:MULTISPECIES: VOC family protein [Acinetobacter]MCD0188922.1 VOC family protein [Acinetobacter sp. PW68]MDM1754796.1 VOC family protein [Acinetobacter towneri]
MQAHISVITLAVEDLQRALDFYRDGLGLATEGIIGQEFEQGAVVFFELQAGLKLALWSKQSLQQDTGLTGTASNATQITLGHNVHSPLEVDQVLKQAQNAGAKILKPAQSTFYGGYAGYFQDLDGHVWEVVYNPCWD